MRELPILNPPTVFVEIGPSLLKALCDDRGIELPLERAANGKLTGAGREKLVAGLKQFLGRKSWQPRARAVCGISAHGVSLRRLVLPAAARDDFENVLRLQIESEFPLSPEELAWGWQEISSGAAGRELLVAAVRKEVIEESSSVLLAAGANPEFTVAALARNALCPQPDAAHAILEIAPSHSELVTFEKGMPGGLRIFPPDGDLVGGVLKNTNAKVICVSGNAAGREQIAKFSDRMDSRPLEVSGGDGCSATTLGLKKCISENRPLPWLQAKPKLAKTSFNLLRPENRRWLKRAAVLLAVLLIFPFAETLLVKPFLGWRLASFKARQQKFVSVVDPEMRFLLYLKQNQPPYLDALYVFSKAAPPGTRLDSFSANQRGEISVKATVQNGQQMADFRAKLIASGFFANITVEEQSQVMNQPKVNVRMSAQWKPAAMRSAVSVSPAANETNKNLTISNAAPSAMPAAVPPAAPPAMPMPAAPPPTLNP